MKGFRTIATNIVLAVLIPPAVASLKRLGIELTAEQQLGLAVDIITGANLVLRYFTTTPIGAKVAAAVGPSLEELKPVVSVLVDQLTKDRAQVPATPIAKETP